MRRWLPRLPEPVTAVLGLLAAEVWLALVALHALFDAGDRTGLPTAVWLMPVAAGLAPWVLPARTDRGRGTQAGVGQLAAVAGAGVMVLQPVAGVLVALAGIAYAALDRTPADRGTDDTL